MFPVVALLSSGYSCTVKCGSNLEGEPFPPHFQLKTLAKTVDGQRIGVDWFGNSKNILAKFGHTWKGSLYLALLE